MNLPADNLAAIPAALHRAASELPFVPFDDFQIQLLQVNIEAGLWVVRTRFEPGTTLQRHKHTGEVFALTYSGSWHYLEYPKDVNRAGSYLYEPAGSIHTLHVPKTNTEVTDVWFAIRGANLNLAADGSVESVLDAGAVLEGYLGLCAAHGLGRPAVMGAA
jgi:2,4'-dihydroxyacetophenone dioxygenase